MRSKSPLGAALVFALLASTAYAQDPNAAPYGAPPPPPPGAQAQTPLYSPEQLDQMLASVALYPDPLLTDVLTASTYPLEVVEAARWLQAPQDAQLSGPTLETALDSQSWDPSVKSIVAFPPVVRLMDAHLDWTQSLGNAFLAQPADVMDSIQRLRHDAQAAGTLASNAQETVTVDGPYIEIQPASPQLVYLPVYSPSVYGSWPYPGYPPVYYGPPPGYSVGLVNAGIGFGVGIAVAGVLWNWGDWDWRDHHVHVDPDRFNRLNAGHPPVAATTWQHDPTHRGGTPYRDAASRARFEPPVPGSAAQRQGYRFYGDQQQQQQQRQPQQQRAAVTPQRSEAQPQRTETPQRRQEAQPQRSPTTQGRPALPPAPAPTAALPHASVAEPTRPVVAAPPHTTRPFVAPVPPPQAPQALRPPTAFQSLSRGQEAQTHAQRGQESRQSAPAAVAHTAPAAPRAAPSAPRAGTSSATRRTRRNAGSSST